MSDTKSVNLTENEIKQIIIWHGYNLNDEGKTAPTDGDMFDRIERIDYLNKRLKAFAEPEAKPDPVQTAQTQTAAPTAEAWPTNG